MTSSGLRPRLAALLTALITCLCLLSLSSLPAWAAAGTITEFPVPSGGGPLFITAGPDGNLWFTEAASNIGRITTGGTITEFPLSTPANRGITAGPDGNLWFTERAGNRIGRITTGGTITEFPLPTHSLTSLPEGITVGPDDNLWFAEFNVGIIGRITPGGNIKEFPVAQSGPFGITTGPDGNLWFTLAFGNSIGRISPSGRFTGLFTLPTHCRSLLFGCTPLGITAGPAHNSDVWFAESMGPKIGRITTK